MHDLRVKQNSLSLNNINLSFSEQNIARLQRTQGVTKVWDSGKIHRSSKALGQFGGQYQNLGSWESTGKTAFYGGTGSQRALRGSKRTKMKVEEPALMEKSPNKRQNKRVGLECQNSLFILYCFSSSQSFLWVITAHQQNSKAKPIIFSSCAPCVL